MSENQKNPQTFVGFGFGAIQAGLFLYEAWRSGNFGRLIVAEVMQEVVDAVRANQGFYMLNLAHADRVETVRVGPIEIYNPATAADREKLIEALVAAQEIATAVPSVNFYESDAPGSIHRLLAQAIVQKLGGKGARAVIYAAENNNHAAELLSEAVMSELDAATRAHTSTVACFANTVLIKMCGILPATAQLPAITPTLQRAFLVEVHNRIQISTIHFEDPDNSQFHRGITIFEEKTDLLPFEEAKLYTLNGVHAAGAYIGAQLGFQSMSQLPDVPRLTDFLIAAGTEEVGPGLCARHAGVDPLFQPENFAHYVRNYVVRMVNPYLQDSIERVGRDPARKLSWNDRLIGAMRLALGVGVEPKRFALGAACAVRQWQPQAIKFPRQELIELWQSAKPTATEVSQLLTILESVWSESELSAKMDTTFI
ncbi:MAG: hypothetical protein U0175_26200 [Caldilineaceae bacterium]